MHMNGILKLDRVALVGLAGPTKLRAFGHGLRRGRGDLQFLPLLNLTFGFGFSDERDRIYDLLALHETGST
jgi:hypothetical protein